MRLPGPDDRPDDGEGGHDAAERQVIAGELLLAPAAGDAQDHDEEPDDRVRPGGFLDREPEDIEEHGDSELSTPDANQAGGGPDGDAGQEPQRSAPRERRLFRLLGGSVKMLWPTAILERSRGGSLVLMPALALVCLVVVFASRPSSAW